MEPIAAGAGFLNNVQPRLRVLALKLTSQFDQAGVCCLNPTMGLDGLIPLIKNIGHFGELFVGLQANENPCIFTQASLPLFV